MPSAYIGAQHRNPQNQFLHIFPSPISPVPHFTVPLVRSVCSTAQAIPNTITADAGYWDTMSLLDPSMKGIELLVSPDSNPQPPEAPLPPSAPRNEEAIRMRKVLASEEGKARYALRKSTVEPVFGQIKEARGIRRFRLRGLSKVTSEWKLICATHNLLNYSGIALPRLRINQAQHHPCRFRVPSAILFG